jgi:hypothetical protein
MPVVYSMEIVALSGLLGLGYLVSKVSNTKEGFNGAMAKNAKAAASIPPADREYPLLTTPQSQPGMREGFMPAARGLNSDPLTLAPKGASATGFGPELDMMYQMPNGQTYPSEPSPGPYGTAMGYASNKPPYAPGFTPGTQPAPSPIDSNVPMTEFRSDNTEADPNYIETDYVISPLSGQKIPSNEFKHNNMQPFFGGAHQTKHSTTGEYPGSRHVQWQWFHAD